MDYSNEKYKKQGIHLLSVVFTVRSGKFKTLLVNRKLEPFKNLWAIPGGALYNDESVESGLSRELFEKTGICDIEHKHFGIYSDVDRAPNFRMVALAYVSVIDSEKVDILNQTSHTNDADWWDINSLPEMAFDHKIMIEDAINYLRCHLYDSNIMKNLFPKEFTLPEIHKAYESVLETKIDRRNFRKKLILDGVIEDTGKVFVKTGTKSSKLYKFVK